MNTVLSENFRKYRLAAGMTQEQVAASLNINAQIVSRWECGTTLPDILTLPVLARLYGITVDDFYKKNSIAYDNYAQRLSAVYEKTSDPEDFLRCVLEFQQLMKDGALSAADGWHLATVYHQMLHDCKEKALYWYDSAIASSRQENPHIYRRARDLRMKLLLQTGDRSAVIAQLEEACSSPSAEAEDWDLLLHARILTENYEEGYRAFLHAIRIWPNNWPLYIHGGEICQALKKYDEAFGYWDKAGKIGTYFHDEVYCKAYCYEDMGEFDKAARILFDLADTLRREHYDVEAEMAEEDARIMKGKTNI